jgi:hypothetical protein
LDSVSLLAIIFRIEEGVSSFPGASVVDTSPAAMGGAIEGIGAVLAGVEEESADTVTESAVAVAGEEDEEEEDEDEAAVEAFGRGGNITPSASASRMSPFVMRPPLPVPVRAVTSIPLLAARCDAAGISKASVATDLFGMTVSTESGGTGMAEFDDKVEEKEEAVPFDSGKTISPSASAA